MINILGNNNSILNQYLAELRDVEIQQDSMRFRRNLQRIGEIFGYEISKTFEYEDRDTVTSLGNTLVPVLKTQTVLATILRAGLPLHQGLLNVFDKAENAFVSAYRKYYKDGRFNVHVEYVSSPDITDKTLIIADSMIATGTSMVLAYRELLAKGRPKHTHIVSVLSSIEGLDYVKRHLPASEVTIWLGAVDDELTAQAFIVPGLGDAGDLAFGGKD